LSKSHRNTIGIKEKIPEKNKAFGKKKYIFPKSQNNITMDHHKKNINKHQNCSSIIILNK
jgi:hypothetical protein